MFNVLQLQRQADDKFRRDLLDLERDRAKNERESLTTIAAAIIGQVAGRHVLDFHLFFPPLQARMSMP